MTDYAEQLANELRTTNKWPLPREEKTLHKVLERKALRTGDKTVLKRLAHWESRAQALFVGRGTREYIVDPLPRTIARAFADFLWGEEPEITAANDRDQQWYEQIVEVNQLPSELHFGEQLCISEGEVWWHIYTDRDVALTPLVEFLSRMSVVPLWRGGRLLAIGVVSEVAREGDGQQQTVWRRFELHDQNHVVNLLFRGGVDKLGEEVPLTSRPEVETILPVWQHQLGVMLAGRVINERGDDPQRPVSEYDQVVDLILALNEARTIGTENARLTAKKRLFMTGSLVQPDPDGNPVAPVDEDVILVDSDGGVLGEGGGQPPIVAAEYSFDAGPLIEHTKELVDTILNRVGLVPQFVGQNVDGHAPSGTSIRLRFMPTVNAARGKAREWDDKLPKILQALALVDSLPEELGGYAREYAALGDPPAVERGDVLPQDETELVNDNAVAVGAEIQSRFTAIKNLHPDWDDKAVDEELARIKDDANLVPATPPGGPGGPDAALLVNPPHAAPIATDGAGKRR